MSQKKSAKTAAAKAPAAKPRRTKGTTVSISYEDLKLPKSTTSTLRKLCKALGRKFPDDLGEILEAYASIRLRKVGQP